MNSRQVELLKVTRLRSERVWNVTLEPIYWVEDQWICAQRKEFLTAIFTEEGLVRKT